MTKHASRNTTTGLNFEEKISMKQKGIDISKYKLYKFLAEKGIDWKQYLSKKLLPDEAYFNQENN
jgi:hypothetical protein